MRRSSVYGGQFGRNGARRLQPRDRRPDPRPGAAAPGLGSASLPRRWAHRAEQLIAFWRPAPGSHLAAMFAAHAKFRTGLLSSFGSARWSLIERQAQLVDHCRLVEGLGAPYDIAPGTIVSLATLDLGEAEIGISLDQAPWLMRDGALTISLWEKTDRMFSLSFTLGWNETGRTAYIGGIQGRRDEAALARCRHLTKAAHGMRPRDLLIEAFRMLCGAMRIDTIRAASNATRHRPRSVRRNADLAPSLDYDALWAERGGTLQPDGCYALERLPSVRSDAATPARKRSLYRQRRKMLAVLAERIADAVGSPIGFSITDEGVSDAAAIAAAADAPPDAALMLPAA